jgi:hypothetical protein
MSLEKQLRIRITDDEYDQLRTLGSQWELSPGATVRKIILDRLVQEEKVRYA